MEISKDTKLCEAYMGKYPVISISLKGINAAAYEDAFDFAVDDVIRHALEHDKSVYRELLDSNMSETVFCGGLKILSKLLEKHYRLKVILLIDEYDVPLAKAFENGYYEQMIFQDYVNVFPENYWINTSSNDAVKKFIQMSDNLKTKREIETLLAGGEIIKEIHQELIYPEMYQSLENVWSLLFMTGYLTQRERVDVKRYKEERKYDEELRENGVDKILKYGIACYMKRCKVKLAEVS